MGKREGKKERRESEEKKRREKKRRKKEDHVFNAEIAFEQFSEHNEGSGKPLIGEKERFPQLIIKVRFICEGTDEIVDICEGQIVRC